MAGECRVGQLAPELRQLRLRIKIVWIQSCSVAAHDSRVCLAGVARQTQQSEQQPTMSESNEASASSTPATKSNSDDKVKVHFVAVGAAPIMKKTKFLISADQRFSSVIAFLRKMLKMANNNGSSLFLYCNSAFVPGPDELVGDLRDCFNIRGELVIHYALQASLFFVFVGWLFLLNCLHSRFKLTIDTNGHFEN